MSTSVAPRPIFSPHAENIQPRFLTRFLAGPSSAGGVLASEITPKLIALAGLMLFACALVVAFRVIALDAVHQLQQPGIDFAICGAVAFLGLSISWVHLGEEAEPKNSDIAYSVPDTAAVSAIAVEPLDQSASQPAAASLTTSTANSSPAQHRQANSQSWTRSYACPFCGHKMVSLGPGRHVCVTCRHTEDTSRPSFLGAAGVCGCPNCR